MVTRLTPTSPCCRTFVLFMFRRNFQQMNRGILEISNVQKLLTSIFFSLLSPNLFLRCTLVNMVVNRSASSLSSFVLICSQGTDGTAQLTLDTMKHYLCLPVVYKNLKSNLRMTTSLGHFKQIDRNERENRKLLSSPGSSKAKQFHVFLELALILVQLCLGKPRIQKLSSIVYRRTQENAKTSTDNIHMI